jgi:toxin ParE1/3/4
MSHRVVVLTRAQDELLSIALWLAERSPEGALRWLDAFDVAKAHLAANPFAFGLAPEDESVRRGIRQVFFKTPHGRRYRALFTVVDDEVRVLHVRGPGQAPMTADEV